jgi:hypothetical protein
LGIDDPTNFTLTECCPWALSPQHSYANGLPVSFGASKSGFQVINYLDDFASADTKQGALKGFHHLAQLLQSLGLAESQDKAQPPAQRMALV